MPFTPYTGQAESSHLPNSGLKSYSLSLQKGNIQYCAVQWFNASGREFF
jgi:hypothetical protein